MKSEATMPDDYIAELPDDRKQAINALRKTLLENLPDGFSEVMSYGMLGYVVPHTLYPKGYHCSPKLPLPFINLGSQKNFIALHYMGFVDKNILDWFVSEYPKHCKTTLDMGVGCIRFKKILDIPVQLIGELATKMTPQDWITLYEKTYIKA
jgi:Domain of unknown function (DU1801)